MIRTRSTDWRVQICDSDGLWFDFVVTRRVAEAIPAYHRITGHNKRLLRNGEPLLMSEECQPSLWEAL